MAHRSRTDRGLDGADHDAIQERIAVIRSLKRRQVRLPGAQRRGEMQMLVLSRHRDESIIIGDDIIITVVDIRGDKVRLGITAPIEISVHRHEVHKAIQREKRQHPEGETHATI